MFSSLLHTHRYNYDNIHYANYFVYLDNKINYRSIKIDYQDNPL